MRRVYEHNQAAWMMYHGAGLARSTGKMPPLKDFMTTGKKQVKGIDEGAIIAQLKAYQRAQDDGTGSK